MAEWHTVHSDDSTQSRPINRAGFFRYRRWLLGGGVVILLLVIGWGVIWGRLAQRRAFVRAELTQVILAEDTAHFLNNSEEAARLINPAALPAWQQAYWQNFETRPLQPPGQIRLEEIDFDGSCATVTAIVTGLAQIRNYCLTDRGWQRSPVPKTVWGEAQPPLRIRSNIQINFLERDRAFAESLADDLEIFFERGASLGLPMASLDYPFEIIIDPYDLNSPLVWQEETHLILNSPWLTPIGELSGDKAVRLALAEAFLQRLGLTSTGSTLPGAERFLKAIQKVIAAQLIFSPEEQADLYQMWQRQLHRQQWHSPFFTDLIDPDNVEASRQADLAALLMADYISRQYGNQILIRLPKRLVQLASWDELFQAMLQRPTFLLEKEVASQVQIDLGFVSALDRDDPISRRLLFTAKVVSEEPQVTDERLICQFMPFFKQIVKHPADKWEQLACFTKDYTSAPSSQDDPPSIELPDRIQLSFPDDQKILASCLPPNSLIEVLGFWLEAGRRLKVVKLEVQEINPPSIKVAPSDSLAYLLEGPRSSPTAFYALSQSHGLQQLLILSDTLKIFPLPVVLGGSPHFLLQQDLPDCNRAWFAHYEPAHGVTRQWLAPPHPVQWVWRADRQDLMFFNPKENSLEYAIYETNEAIIPEQVGISTSPLSFLGWNVEAGRLVSTASWFNEIYVGLFDMTTGQITPMARPYYQPLQGRRLSPDGNWLAYLGGARNILGPPDRLDALALADETNVTLIQVEKGEGLSPPSWSLYLEHPDVAILSGPVVAENLAPSRLLVASPYQPNRFTLVAQTGPGEQLATPVFCSDGKLLYRIEQDGHYRLQRQLSDAQAEMIAQFERPLWPIACP